MLYFPKSIYVIKRWFVYQHFLNWQGEIRKQTAIKGTQHTNMQQQRKKKRTYHFPHWEKQRRVRSTKIAQTERNPRNPRKPQIQTRPNKTNPSSNSPEKVTKKKKSFFFFSMDLRLLGRLLQEMERKRGEQNGREGLGWRELGRRHPPP